MCISLNQFINNQQQLHNIVFLRLIFFSWQLQLRPSCSCQLSPPSCPPSCGPLPPGPAWRWWRWCTGSPGSRPAWRRPGGSPPPWAGPGRWRGPEAGSAGSGCRAPGRTGWTLARPGGGPAGGWPPGRPRRPRLRPSRRRRRRMGRPPGWTWEQRRQWAKKSQKPVKGNNKSLWRSVKLKSTLGSKLKTLTKSQANCDM